MATQCDGPVVPVATSGTGRGRGALTHVRLTSDPRVPTRRARGDSVGAMEADDPRATAVTAARTAGVVIIDGQDLDHAELSELADLFGHVWGRDVAVMGSIVSGEILWACSHVGSPVAAAYADGELVGGTVGFAGVHGGTVRVHSHLAGVLPSVAGRGIGRALKWHQRAWCLDHGIGTVEWTFDPLVRRNAVINLVHLGAKPVDFLPNLYGAMVDERNAGLDTDRFLVRWELDDARVVQAASGRHAEPRVEGLRRAGAVVVLDVDEHDQPVTTPSDAPRQLARIPADIEAIRAHDPDRAAAWGAALRQTLGRGLAEGMRVTGITRDGWYVLARVGGVTEMA